MCFRKLLLGMSLVLPALTSADPIRLESSYPEDNATGVSLSAAIQLRFSDALDVSTLHEIRLQSNGEDIEVRRSTDLTNASITIVPIDFLPAEHTYALVGSTKLRGSHGAPVATFRLTFKTGASADATNAGLLFHPKRFDKTRSTTTVLIGPDRRLYAATAFGELFCWTLDEVGRPIQRQWILKDPDQSRQYIDLEWDPTASPDDLVLWVSYAERLVAESDPRRYFTGTIARLTIREDRVVDEQRVVIGLPHGREAQGGHETLPHQPNGLCFKDGRLYQSVGSTSSSGGPPNWGVVEQPLSACILEIDYQQIGADTLDVSPLNQRFDPSSTNARVRRFATGVRNALEIVAHSNGRLYTAVNINDRRKRSDGVPDDPDLPGDQNALIENVTPDHESLFILERGRHYGFRNPSIGNYVLGGGNPTSELDPFEISDYPIGTPPEQGFAPELMFPIWQWGGTSPNGMIEYQPAGQHPLTSALLCCFYSANDIAVMPLGDDGLPTAVEKLRGPNGKLPLAGPLDITQDRTTGCLYVADFGKQRSFGEDGSLIWLRPVAE